jgi:hypothetical protein
MDAVYLCSDQERERCADTIVGLQSGVEAAEYPQQEAHPRGAEPHMRKALSAARVPVTGYAARTMSYGRLLYARLRIAASTPLWYSEGRIH